MINNKLRFLSLILAVLMTAGAFSFSVLADGEESANTTDSTQDTVETTSATEDETELTSSVGDASGDASQAEDSESTEEEEVLSSSDYEDIAKKYYLTPYITADEKIATMKLEYSAFGYEIYCDEFSGEVCVKNTKTGQRLFTNPFDVQTSESTDDIKKQLLSQIKLTYSGIDGEIKTMYSFEECVSKGQVTVKSLKDGIRVEYAIGDEETRYLVPRLITKERYEKLILPYIEASDDTFVQGRFDTFYVLEGPDSTEQMHAKFPITETTEVYVYDTEATTKELRDFQGWIKKYCKNYTYATLQEDHDLTGYTVTDIEPPLFRMAIEYTIDEDGLEYRLPANGIRYNSDLYTLMTLQVLPYFGAGSSQYTGYTFVPDGSGAVFRFEDLVTSGETKTGKIYGSDYAYHDIGIIKQETMRLPVFGVVENYNGFSCEIVEKWVDAYTDEKTGVSYEAGYYTLPEYTPLREDRGYCAIIEEGDSLVSITTNSGGTVHKYNTVYAEFNPCPTDEYNLADSISVGDNKPITISSNRKFTGSYKVRAVMLCDENTAKNAGLSEDEYYECSYVGMAKAYRDYLENTGVLTRIEDASEDIPLYVESFGAIETASTFLSFPTTKMVALTTFDDIKTMANELEENGITNINFRLKGFANGGLDYTVPNGVEFEDVVGGEEGYKDLVSFAKERGIGIFPDFDFSYANTPGNGFTASEDSVKTIDGRYTKKRVYKSSLQETVVQGGMCLSASVFNKYYDNIVKDLKGLETIGISAGTLGTDLNSDFDKSDPYNREDCKQIVQQLLAKMKEDYGEVMVDGGNAYTLASANHILNVKLDSSHFNKSAYSIPFVGMVLHGYVNFAGTPTNMSSDIEYEKLKMIENGSMPYFTLSYSNTPLLKDSKTYSNYYSVAYEIWIEDLISDYKELNSIMKDLQNQTIDSHEFLVGKRNPSESELADDIAEAEAKKAEEEAKAQALAEKLERAEILAQRKGGAVINLDDEDDADENETQEETTQTAPTAEEVADINANTDKYTVNDGSIVKITYSNGTTFILNYNRFAVTVEGLTIEPLGYIRQN